MKALPDKFLEAFSHGVLPISAPLLSAFTGSPQLLSAALPRIAERRPTPEQIALTNKIASFGVGALSSVAELLGNSDGHVRQMALTILESVLAKVAPGCRDWMAEHATTFPLDHPDEDARQRLQEIMSTFLLDASAWEDPRLKPMLVTLLRASDETVVARTIRCLAEMDGVALELGPALEHPTPGIRLGAIWAIGRTLPRDESARRELAQRLLACAPASDDEVRIHLRSVLFRLDALPEEQLLDSLRELALGVIPPSGLFFPERPAQLRALARLLFENDPAVAELARKKLLTYTGELEREDRAELVQILRDPRSSGRTRPLVTRWPELVPMAFVEEADWTELPTWIADLGEAVESGLVEGLDSPDPRVRLRSLAVVRDLGVVESVLLLMMVQNCQTDPEPEVADRAGETLRHISLRSKPL